MKKLVPVIIGVVAVLAALTLGGFYILQYNQAYHECNVEAGVSVAADTFLKSADSTAVFADESEVLDTHKPGDYNLVIKTKYFKHKILVHVLDTIAPTAEAVDVRADFGTEVLPEDFVKNVSDATEVTASFITKPDYSMDGIQTVKILLMDMGGNTTTITSNLTISFIKSVVNVEAGSEIPGLGEFLLGECNAELMTDLSAFDYNTLSDNEVLISIDGTVYTSNLKIVDTVAPSLELCNVTGFTKAFLSIDRFVVFADDITGVAYRYEKEPDFNLTGEQQITIICSDAAGNETVKTTSLTLAEDNEAPVISGLKDFVSYTGHAISFKSGVNVTDNNPENLVLEVDTGNLDINIPGEYTVVYTATDASGNSTDKSIVITIRGKEYTDEFVKELADAAIAKIVKPGMTQVQICEAIFNYVRKNLTFYTGHSPKLFWQQGAVDAFVDGIGDCYMYACMARALFNSAGIPNMEITRSEGARPTSHYWNLVNPDNTGWWHFDCLTMRDGTRFLWWTDAQIKEYDVTHPGYHTYDADLYPVIN